MPGWSSAKLVFAQVRAGLTSAAPVGVADKYKYMYAPSRLCDHARTVGVRKYNEIFMEDKKNRDLMRRDVVDFERLVSATEGGSGPIGAPSGPISAPPGALNRHVAHNRRSPSPPRPESWAAALSPRNGRQQVVSAPPGAALPASRAVAASGPTSSSSGEGQATADSIAPEDIIPRVVASEADGEHEDDKALPEDNTAELLARLESKDKRELNAHADVLRRLIASLDGKESRGQTSVDDAGGQELQVAVPARGPAPVEDVVFKGVGLSMV